ncbi:competence protein ComK [Bacillus sp. FJAT-52991]|uniref:Competence protein ComK n=1 Tax=Bacillus kandeliae TaxID=3129297 RepID=A0ABZ2N8H4_9BACI
MNNTHNEYFIRPEVMFIKAIECRGKEHTIVVEEKRTFELTVKPLDLIKKSCLAYGATYDGRRKASKLLLATDKKLPVIIDHFEGTYLFPLASHIRQGNLWISLSKVESFSKIDSKQVSILFTNGQRFSFPITERSLKNQHGKASRLKIKLKQQIHDLYR